MNKYNNSYFLKEIVKEIKDKLESDINNIIKKLGDFIINNDTYYNKVDSFNNIKEIVKSLINLDTPETIGEVENLNSQQLIIEINKLIYYIDYETYIGYQPNRYNADDYDYIEEKLISIVYNTKI